jgi:acyl-CoA thioester hydrolase
MYHATDGYLAATNELLSLHIDLETRRVGSMADVIQVQLQSVMAAHAKLPVPDGAGRVLGMRRK